MFVGMSNDAILEPLRTENWSHAFDECGAHSFSSADKSPETCGYCSDTVFRAVGREGAKFERVRREHIAEILFLEQEHDDAESSMGDWGGALVARTHAGRYVLVTTWHDYTGWG